MIGFDETDPSRILVRRGQNYFRISEDLWSVVDRLQQGVPSHEIIENLRNVGAISDPVEVGPIMLARGIALIESEDAMSLTADSPRFGIEVEVEALVRLLQQLIGTSFLKPLPLAAAAALAIVVPIFSGAVMPVANVTEAIIVATAMFFIMMCHELGHAVAATAFGCRPHRIGLGIWFILPTFYADVSEIWRLSIRSRTMVNLAGVAIQMWLGALLAVAMLTATAPWQPLFSLIAMINLTSVLLNLIPFARLDGYWVIADLARVPDLQVRSFRELRRLLLGGIYDRDRKSASIALSLFAIFSLVFYGLGIFLLLRMLVISSLTFVKQPDAFGAAQMWLAHPLSWIAAIYLAASFARITIARVKRWREA